MSESRGLTVLVRVAAAGRADARVEVVNGRGVLAEGGTLAPVVPLVGAVVLAVYVSATMPIVRRPRIGKSYSAVCGPCKGLAGH